jgi:hypothetical protein
MLKDPFNIKEGYSLYFRIQPQVEDWINIILIRALREVNFIYTIEKKETNNLRRECEQVVKEKTGQLGYYWSRVKRIVLGIFTYAIVFLMIGMQLFQEVNIISWLFFVLNLLSFGMMIRGNQKSGEIQKQYLISSFTKYFSLVIILANVFLLVLANELNDEKK